MFKLLLTMLFSTTIMAEKLGNFSVDEVVLNASFEYTDPRNGEFSIDGSLFTLKWENEKNLYVLLSVGPTSLLNIPIYFNTDINEFDLLEASANYSGVYGQVSMGLQQIGFSYEGRLKENERFFYRGLVFTKKLIPLRDFGISYKTGHGHFKTSVTVTNGEGVPGNPDGRVFYTGFWGWESNSFQVGLSGLTGQVKTESLNTDITQNLNLFDPTSKIKIRSGSIYTQVRSKYFDILGEFFLGQVEQREDIKKWHAWHADVIYKSTGRVDALARVDYIDPNRSFGGDAIREYTVGLSLRDKQRNSRIFLYATKVIDEGAKDKANDRYSLVWRVQPKVLDLY